MSADVWSLNSCLRNGYSYERKINWFKMTLEFIRFFITWLCDIARDFTLLLIILSSPIYSISFTKHMYKKQNISFLSAILNLILGFVSELLNKTNSKLEKKNTILNGKSRYHSLFENKFAISATAPVTVFTIKSWNPTKFASERDERSTKTEFMTSDSVPLNDGYGRISVEERCKIGREWEREKVRMVARAKNWMTSSGSKIRSSNMWYGQWCMASGMWHQWNG